MNSKNALSGNRTRASRVAGENSTTEPTMLVSEISFGYYKLKAPACFGMPAQMPCE